MTRVAGVDVSATRLHVVALSGDAQVIGTAVMDSTDVGAAASWLDGCSIVAIDAPDRPSQGIRPEHVGVGRKFLSARCAEIGLGQQFALWVPWVTPHEPPYPAWMERGFELFAALGDDRTIEVYPHAIFRVLASLRQLPKKTGIAGGRERITLLEARGIRIDHLQMWSHDALDALAAAIVALDHHHRRARAATCGHDGSAMWLPAAAESGEELEARRDPA